MILQCDILPLAANKSCRFIMNRGAPTSRHDTCNAIYSALLMLDGVDRILGFAVTVTPVPHFEDENICQATTGCRQQKLQKLEIL